MQQKKLKNKAEELQKVEKGEREEKAGKNNKKITGLVHLSII